MQESILFIVAYNVKQHRLKLNISQEELAFRSHLHKNYLSDIECGKRNISLLSLSKVAEGLKVSPRDLLNESAFQKP